MRLIGFGGGIRGTKTWGTLATLLVLCRVYPNSRWHVVRKDLERLKDTTIPSFEKLTARFHGFVGRLNRQDWFVRCRNGSEIHFIGENIDRDPELARFHGFETNGFLLDDGDELAERTFVKCIERAGTWIVPDGEQPPPYIFATFNPSPGWVKRRFYEPWTRGQLQPPYAFIPSTAADNPYISDEQRTAWKEMPEAEYRRFVMGDWESFVGAYYDALDPTVLIERDALPTPWPAHWRYYASYDWGYRHWAVCGFWATDTDGTDYLLDSVWIRQAQDEEMAQAIRGMTEGPNALPPQCLATVYAGHDCWNKVTARGASGESTADVFARSKILLTRADIDLVNGGRAVNRQLKNGRVRIVKTKANLKGYDQLGEIMPDEHDVRKPRKVDADTNGLGGDDFADMFRYGIATKVRAAELPATDTEKLPDRAVPLADRIEGGKLVPVPKPPQTIEELLDKVTANKYRTRVPSQTRSPKWR
ncbi:MAG: hypothetical protein KGI71_05410 [Patescibacteria group bacterium]|nr:hypothetical protein [Patescibacteria group bacterium]